MKSGDFKQLLKDYFTFTRQERTGMLVLCTLLVLSVAVSFMAGRWGAPRVAGPEEKKRFLECLEGLAGEETENAGHLFPFNPNTIAAEVLDSLAIPPSMKTNLLRYREKGGRFRKAEDFRKMYGMTDSLFDLLLPYIQIAAERKSGSAAAPPPAGRERFPFNPATVTDEELTRLGFTPFQKRNLLSYRSRGGHFYHKTDLLKVYGMDTSFYRDIESLIAEEEPEQQVPEPAGLLPVELNGADSSLLITLPGIGPSFAARIIRYRQLLGGYYSVNQLLEVYGMTPEKLSRFSRLLMVDTSRIRMVRLNFTGEYALSRHPYISDGQARAIIQLRSANGPFDSPVSLLTNKVFSDSTFLKVRPYLTCQ